MSQGTRIRSATKPMANSVSRYVRPSSQRVTKTASYGQRTATPKSGLESKNGLSNDLASLTVSGDEVPKNKTRVTSGRGRVYSANKTINGIKDKSLATQVGNRNRKKSKDSTGDQHSESSYKSSNEEGSVNDGIEDMPIEVPITSTEQFESVKPIYNGTSSRVDEASRNGNSEQSGANNTDTSAFSCETKSDVTSPWLRGITCLAGGDIICLDLNNECLKRFKRDFTFVSSIEISSDNNGITAVSDSEIAVTCLNEVHFYNVGKFGMSRSSKHFRLKGTGFGISHDNNWYAITCDIMDEYDAAIRVLDEDGNEQYVIETREIGGVDVTLSWYIQMNEMKERVFVSDAGHPRVICFGFSGEVIWTIPIEGSPRGLGIFNDSVVVSDQLGQCVLAIDQDGKTKTKLFTFEDGIFNPDYIVFCRETRQLFVTYRGFGMVGKFTIQR